jgi:hypothetical protein
VVAAAATGGDFPRAATHAQQVTDHARHLHHSVVCDIHPQAAFDAYATLADGTRTPA